MATNIDISIRYSTFLPMLLEAMARTNGDVLELGAGVFSTPLLHWLCERQRRNLLTIDNSLRWLRFARQYLRTDSHQFQFVENWEDAHSYINKEWDVALIDHSPSGRRIEEIKKLADKVKYLVVHDSESWKDNEYHYSTIYPLFKYIYNFDKADHQTVVLSNFAPVNDFWP